MSRVRSTSTGAVLLAASIAVLGAAPACKKSHASAGAAEGKTLFLNNCARCHGTDGAGGLPVFDGGPSPRNFRDHAFHDGRTDDQIRMTIVNGKGTGMPPFGTMFDDTQLTALVAYVRSLDPEGKK